MFFEKCSDVKPVASGFLFAMRYLRGLKHVGFWRYNNGIIEIVLFQKDKTCIKSEKEQWEE